MKRAAINLLIAAISGDLGPSLGRLARSSRSTPRRGGAPSPRPLRMAYARIQQETNALSPVLTTVADFEAVHLLEGEALTRAIALENTEAEGFLHDAELSGFAEGARDEARRSGSTLELIPTCSAWAVPSGPLTRQCYDEIVERVLAPLRRAVADGPLDAVFLSLHGAMGVRDLPLPTSDSPDSEIVRRVREVVGDIPIGVTLDLHGNLCPGLVDRTTVIQAYRTNPHRDHFAVGARVGAILVRTARGEVRPVQAWRTLPMLLGGGITLDFWRPLRSIFQRMAQLDRDPHVLASSLFTVHPWNDHRELGWSTLVVTDGAPSLAESLAEELAERAWEVRHQLPPKFRSVEEAIARISASPTRRLGPAIIADVSDVVSAGAPGDNTRVLGGLLEHGADIKAYVAIRDPKLVAELWGGHQVGETLNVTVGGSLDPARGAPVTTEATIERMPRAHGVGRMVVLAIGRVKLVVTEGPAFAIQPAFYRNAGLRIRDAEAIVVKNFFPFLMFFFPYTLNTHFVKTRGVTDFDAAYDLDFAGPIHPRDNVLEWRSADRRRRARPPKGASAGLGELDTSPV